MKIGDFVKGTPGAPYGITNERMTRGVVTDVQGNRIRVRVLEHTDGETGEEYDRVEAKYFQVIDYAPPITCDDINAMYLNLANTLNILSGELTDATRAVERFSGILKSRAESGASDEEKECKK